jgi:hypothetical protein
MTHHRMTSKRYHLKEEIKTFPVISSEYGLIGFIKVASAIGRQCMALTKSLLYGSCAEGAGRVFLTNRTLPLEL